MIKQILNELNKPYNTIEIDKEIPRRKNCLQFKVPAVQVSRQ